MNWVVFVGTLAFSAVSAAWVFAGWSYVEEKRWWPLALLLAIFAAAFFFSWLVGRAW